MPLSDEQAAILDELERISDEAVRLFEKFIKTHQKAVLDKLIDLLGRLNVDKNSRLVFNIQTTKDINAIVLGFRNALLSKEYVKQVANFAAFYKLTAGIQNKYFQTFFKNFTPNKLLTELLKDTIQDTMQTLIGAGIDANVVQGLKNILLTNISTGGSLAQLRNQLSIYINGNADVDGKLLRYTKQLTTDSINQFNANYMATITSDLGLKWYFYKGSLLKTSRTFCQKRANKYFHESEVRSWASLNWQGKIPATNGNTIFIFRGGYNCGHLLVPVHELAVPNADKERIN